MLGWGTEQASAESQLTEELWGGPSVLGFNQYDPNQSIKKHEEERSTVNRPQLDEICLFVQSKLFQILWSCSTFMLKYQELCVQSQMYR